MLTLTLELPSRLAEGNALSQRVRGLCRAWGCTSREVDAFELCTLEVFNNTVEHAHRFDDSQTIRLEFMVADGVAAVTIRDRGTSMDPTRLSAEMPIPNPEDPDTWSERGRGIPIIKSLMDEVSYVSTDGENIFQFGKRLSRMNRDASPVTQQADPAPQGTTES